IGPLDRSGSAPRAREIGGLKMGGKIQTGNIPHDQACAIAEGVRQAALIGVTQNAAGQVTSNNAEIAYARAVVASCVTNNGGQGAEPFRSLLRALGTGGS